MSHSKPRELPWARKPGAFAGVGLGELGWGRASWKIVAIGTALAATSLAHHWTPIESVILHNVYQRLYYLPIIAAAYWFGLRGAIVTSLMAAVGYLPHILVDWQGVRGLHDEYLAAQYAELVLFQVVAVVVGLLTESERRLRERQARTSTELADAYEKLQESFEQLRRADRLSALGELSTSIAHEIKNPLASIKGSLEIVAEEFPPGHGKREFIEIMEKELKRLNTIVTEFLEFARPPRPVKVRCDIHEVVESLRVLCSQEAVRHSVELSVTASESIPELNVDASQLQQAMLNVVLNGIQAMSNGGRLDILLAPSDGGVRIEIRDQGAGIPPDDRERIFDPFFTTKARGTGLGLPIAQKLIRAQGGDVHLLERDGPGAAFVILVPSGSGHA